MESASLGVLKKIYHTIVHNYEDLDGPKHSEESKYNYDSKDCYSTCILWLK